MTQRHTARDRAHTLLSATERRFVLSHLNGQAKPEPLSSVAAAFVAWQEGERPTDVSYDEQREVAVVFHHVHLPMLGRAGVLDYDSDDRAVTAWRHDNLHDRWLDDPPVDRLAKAVEE
ncbi:DUF7344 domain-containing protein [Halogeometricum limi]|uniref:DUF7344 domain-containing protein n=1 Tax=Halogeometricum limi TaxID=555875 RepID=A0A1I6HLQ8_9EURY|nr:hypothetical protein [Halogeometricum limi]SFR55385.1 hypothetical protein SAMN04488124_2378 [Halogeometricum limi]